MNLYKHYSFDLWMTLIKSEPSFKKERAKFFYKNFNAKNKSMEDVTSIFIKVDLLCNAINEKTGKNIDAEEMYLMVISELCGIENSFTDINLKWLNNEMELLLLNNMPVVYSVETIPSLEYLSQKNNCSFNISSNTAFIKGKTLRKVLDNLQLSKYFDFQLYSDEIGISKPDKRFFEVLLKSIKNIPFQKGISHNEIVHIGDNPKADITGALSVGINGVLINSNEVTISSLLNL